MCALLALGPAKEPGLKIDFAACCQLKRSALAAQDRFQFGVEVDKKRYWIVELVDKTQVAQQEDDDEEEEEEEREAVRRTTRRTGKREVRQLARTSQGGKL